MKKIASILPLSLLICCGKTGPMERIEELSEQRSADTGSLATIAGHSEGIIFTMKGSEFTPSFSKTKKQTNLYHNTLKAMQGLPYSVDPSGQTVYTDWFDNGQKGTTKITVLIEESDVVVNVFTKRNGQAIKDAKQTADLTAKIKE